MDNREKKIKQCEFCTSFLNIDKEKKDSICTNPESPCYNCWVSRTQEGCECFE